MDKALQQIQITLDSLKRQAEGLEFWSARELMEFLGYTKWQTFSEVIEKAKQACKTSEQSIPDHFTDAGKMVLTEYGTQPQK